MGQFNGVSLVIASLDLTGSISSALGAGFIALCYLILPLRKHFRHSLILNLAIAGKLVFALLHISNQLLMKL